jgi:hypothetical protein
MWRPKSIYLRGCFVATGCTVSMFVDRWRKRPIVEKKHFARIVTHLSHASGWLVLQLLLNLNISFDQSFVFWIVLEVGR